jgi:hypothetical protein
MAATDRSAIAATQAQISQNNFDVIPLLKLELIEGPVILADRWKLPMDQHYRSVCFVIMPFGRKPDAAGRVVDFDRIYADVMSPAVEAAGLAVVRADEEKGAGFVIEMLITPRASDAVPALAQL